MRMQKYNAWKRMHGGVVVRADGGVARGGGDRPTWLYSPPEEGEQCVNRVA